MITQIDHISTPPTPADTPADFEQKASQVWADLFKAVPQMNEQAQQIEAIGQAAVAAGQSAQEDSDAALGYRNEAVSARNSAQVHAVSAEQSDASSQYAMQQSQAARDEAAGFAQGLQAALNAIGGYMPNAIINPNMEVCWRGASFNIPAAASYAETHTLDRWRISKVSAAAATVSQVQGNSTWRATMCLQYSVTTAMASLASGSYEMIEQPIEGYNINDLVGTNITFSAQVYSSKVGKYTVRLYNPLANQYYLHEIEITTANSWQLVAFVVPTSGSVSWAVSSNGIGLRVGVVLAAGSAVKTANLDAWTSGSFIGGANQVNLLDTVGAVFRMTDVQLYRGEKYLALPRRPIQVERDLCYRYLPVRNPDTAGTYGSAVGQGYAYSTSAAVIQVPFRVPARVAPTGIQLNAVLSAHWITGVDGTPYATSSLSLYGYKSTEDGSLTAQIGSASLAAGSATALFAKGPILYLGCEL